MKNLEKVMALIIAMVMVLGMSVTAFAENVNLKVNDDSNSNHTYKVYQLFTGEVAADGVTLSNIKYGEDYGDGTLAGQAISADDAAALEALGTTAAAADSYAASVTYVENSPIATLNSDNSFTASVAPGYYLIKDVTDTDDLDEGDALSKYILQVVEETSIDPKKEETTVDKTIASDTLGTSTNTINGDVDNVSIGDTVTYQIKATIPETAADYDYFFFIIGDTLDSGLTYNSISSVTVGGTTIGANNGYKLYTGQDANDEATYADGKTFQIALQDAKSNAGKEVVVTYTATLNENAEVGETANENTVTVEYSNDPYHDYSGDNEPEDEENPHPGKPASRQDVPLGETTPSITETYTTEIKIYKKDESNNALEGAAFTISGTSLQTVVTTYEDFDESEAGTYYKLADGKYTETPPVTEDYMEEAAAGATEGYVIVASGEDVADGVETVTIGETQYRPYVAETDSEKTIYTLVEANTDLYDADALAAGTKYAKVTKTQSQDVSSNYEATATVDDEGYVSFTGLGAGTYTISETTTPDGYNTIADQTLVIDFTATPAENANHWSKNASSTATNAAYNSSTGAFEITIVNEKGTVLPETGGIGTTLFYIAGAILVIGAGVVLITRRRMAAR